MLYFLLIPYICKSDVGKKVTVHIDFDVFLLLKLDDIASSSVVKLFKKMKFMCIVYVSVLSMKCMYCNCSLSLIINRGLFQLH